MIGKVAVLKQISVLHRKNSCKISKRHFEENIILRPETWGGQATRYPSSLISSAMTIVGVPNTQRVLFGTNSTLRFNTNNQANGHQVGSPCQLSPLCHCRRRCHVGLQRWRMHPLRVFFFLRGGNLWSRPWHGARTWTNLLGPFSSPSRIGARPHHDRTIGTARGREFIPG